MTTLSSVIFHLCLICPFLSIGFGCVEHCLQHFADRCTVHCTCGDHLNNGIHRYNICIFVILYENNISTSDVEVDVEVEEELPTSSSPVSTNSSFVVNILVSEFVVEVEFSSSSPVSINPGSDISSPTSDVVRSMGSLSPHIVW